jgi:hypothetical protein
MHAQQRLKAQFQQLKARPLEDQVRVGMGIAAAQ